MERIARTLSAILVSACLMGPAVADEPALDAARAHAIAGRDAYAEGRFGDAVTAIEAALAGFADLLGPAHREVTETRVALGDAYRRLGRYEDAGAAYERAIADIESAATRDALNLRRARDGLGQSLRARHRYADAATVYERLVADLESVGEPRELWRSLGALALCETQLGRYAAAEERLERALAVFEDAFGPGHPESAITLSELAATKTSRRAFDDAEPLYRKALAILDASPEAKPAQRQLTLERLGFLNDLQGRHTEAAMFYERSVALLRAMGTVPDALLGRNLYNLASVYVALGRQADAEPLLREVLVLWEARYGTDHPQTRQLKAAIDRLTDDKIGTR